MQSAHTTSSPGVHDAHHEDLGFWRGYVFSTDHKVIGIQYGVTALFFLLFGFCLMLMMRWQIAHPNEAIPLVGGLLEKLLGDTAKEGKMSLDLYNSFGAMHGTIMVFMAIVPLAFAAFGNYVVPLQIGAPDMAFPRVNMASYQAYVIGGLILFVAQRKRDGPLILRWRLPSLPMAKPFG
jgi:cytochrome c oxidase subunit 1